MSKILILDAGKQFAHSKGELNHTMANVAETFLRDQGHEVQVTRVDDGYDIKEEVQKYVDSDVVIYQMPGWWMGEPWILKNISMKCSPKATARCTPAMGAPVPTPARNMVPAACCRAKIYAVADTERAAGSLYRSRSVL